MHRHNLSLLGKPMSSICCKRVQTFFILVSCIPIHLCLCDSSRLQRRGINHWFFQLHLWTQSTIKNSDRSTDGRLKSCLVSRLAETPVVWLTIRQERVKIAAPVYNVGVPLEDVCSLESSQWGPFSIFLGPARGPGGDGRLRTIPATIVRCVPCLPGVDYQIPKNTPWIVDDDLVCQAYAAQQSTPASTPARQAGESR
jgi:hypothetical protein